MQLSRLRKTAPGTVMGASGMVLGSVALILALSGVAVGQSGLEQSKSSGTLFGSCDLSDPLTVNGLGTRNGLAQSECGRTVTAVVATGLRGIAIPCKDGSQNPCQPGAPVYSKSQWERFTDMARWVVDSRNAALNVVTAESIAPAAVQAEEIAPDSVTGNAIVDDAIRAIKIANDAITAAKLAANSVTAPAIANNAITSPAIANGAVSAGSLLAGAASLALSQDGGVTSSLLANGAVTAPKIADNAVQPGDVDLPTVEVSSSFAQAMSGLATSTGIFFNTDVYDPDGLHDPVTNHHRLTATEPGVYDVKARVTWAADPDGFRQLELIKFDASTNTSDLVKFTTVQPRFDENGAAAPTPHELNAQVKLDTGDFLHVRGRQASAPCVPLDPPNDCYTKPLNIEANPTFSMTWESQG